MDAAEARDRILRFLDRHHRVPAGSMIRLGGLWSCKSCRADVLTWRPGERRFGCPACGTPVGTPVRSLPDCCRDRRFRVAGGDLYDSDHYLEEENLTAALCEGCLRLHPIVPEPESAPTTPGLEAVREIGRSLEIRAIPALLPYYADPALRDEVDTWVRAIVAAAPADPPPVPPHVAEKMRQRIAESRDPWPRSVAKENGALPLHADEALYLWSIRPDGVLLHSDLDTALNTTETRDHPLTRFAMMLRGIRAYPELVEFLHPPRGATPCRPCLATGRGDRFSCGRCQGLGWITG